MKHKCSFQYCKNKLNMMSFNCDCEGKYCLKHRLPEEHNCIYSHKEKELHILENKLFSQKTENHKIDNKL